MEENFRITPKFWRESATDGTIEKLAAMMDTDIYGLMGVSVCNEKDEWEYYIAVATTKAPEIELYLNPGPDKTQYEIWLPIVRKGRTL